MNHRIVSKGCRLGRLARLVMPDYPHHVTQRGSRRQRTFFRETDYRMYVDLLSKARERVEIEVWAYCLMPNHVHIIVVPKGRDSLANFFGQAHCTYARVINAREGWQGHLWQERFHSYVMDEHHLLAAVRYTELNPVRAGMCDTPGEWPWSSYRAHLSGEDDKLVNVGPMLARVSDWTSFVQPEENDAKQIAQIRELSRTGHAGGSDQFIKKLESLVGRKIGKRRPGRPKKVKQ